MPKSEKTLCNISREEFTKARTIRIIVQQEGASVGQFETLGIYDLPAKTMTTGSLGWHSAEKIGVKVGPKMTKTQANLQLIIIGSKDLPTAE